MIAGLAVATGAEPELGPLAATYVLILAIAGPVATRLVERWFPSRPAAAVS